MSADFNTHIKISGNKEGIIKAIEVLNYYVNERRKKYSEGEPYVDYLESVSICKGNRIDLKNEIDIEKIADVVEFVNELKDDQICVDAMGPYGRGFATLDEIDLYNDLAAKVADNAEFEGDSSGFNTLGRQYLKVIYKNGDLKKDLDIENADDEEEEDIAIEQAVNDIIGKLPLDVFKSIFKINAIIYDEDYESMIEELLMVEGTYDDLFGDKDGFEEFINDYIDSDDEYSISDKEFRLGLIKVEKIGIRKMLWY